MAGLLGQGWDDPQSAAIMALAAGMMQGNAGAGLLGANQAYSDSRNSALRGALAKQQLDLGNMTMEESRRKLADEAASRQVLQQFYQNRGMPASAPGATPAAPVGGPTGAVNSALPPEMQIGALPATPAYQAFQAQQPAGGVTPKAEVWKQYNALADQLAAKGLVTQAQQYYGLAEKMRPKYSTTPQVVKDPTTGKLINVLVAEDGTIQPVQYGVKPDMTIEKLGGTARAIDKNALNGGESFDMTMTPGEVASNKLGWANNAATLRGQNLTDSRAREQHNIELAKADPFGTLGLNKNVPAGVTGGAGLSGDEFLSTLQPGLAAQVKAIAEGKIQVSPMNTRTPQGQALLQMAMQYEPGTDQTTYQKRNATAKDAASGKLAQSNNALNTVAGHLAALSEAADALNNTRFPVVNSAVNWLQSSAGDPRVKSFNMNVQGVANELERAYRGAGGTESDIKLWRETLNSANSPEQFKGIFAKGAEMLQSKLEANQEQYSQGMSGKVGDYRSITPKSAAAFAKLRGQPSTGAVPAVGAVEGGFRFKGGNPADPNSWVKQ